MDLEKIPRKVMTNEIISNYRLTRSIWLAGAIIKSDLSEAIIKDSTFYQTELTSTKFVGTTFLRVRFVKCKISRCDFMSAILNSCSFEDCDIEDINMSLANLQIVEFRNCNSFRTALNDATMSSIFGWDIIRRVDLKKNLLVYNATEKFISHPLISGSPQACVKKLWESDKLSKKYVDNLVALIVQVSGIRIGKDTLK